MLKYLIRDYTISRWMKSDMIYRMNVFFGYIGLLYFMADNKS